jgi:hypothetical protein
VTQPANKSGAPNAPVRRPRAAQRPQGNRAARGLVVIAVAACVLSGCSSDLLCGFVAGLAFGAAVCGLLADWAFRGGR